MHRFNNAIFLSALSFAAIGQLTIAQQAVGQPASSADHAEKAWIKQSNDFTNMLLKVQLEHSPEQGSAQGVAAFDERISDPSRADQAAARRELEAALSKIKAARSTVTDKNVQEDIDILQKSFNLQFRREDFELAHEVPFYNASAQIFQGLTEAQAYKVLEKDVMLSHAFAKEEVERFTFRSPGQANSYFYGYTRLLSLRKETEAALGKKFDQKKFHDFILSQGLLPPDLMRAAVLEDFIPSQR
jgi:uncharacterized protein (DUF885 family)